MLCPWDFPRNNTGVCCHFLLWGTFQNQSLKSRFLHWQADYLWLTHQGNPVKYFSVIKMNKTVSLLERWMNLLSVIQRRKSEREKQRLNINVYVWDWEEWHRWPYLQSRNQDSDIETKCMVPRGKGLGWEELEYWDWHIHTTDTMCKIDTCWEYTIYHRELSLIHRDVLNAGEIQSERVYVYVYLITFSME